MDLLHSTLELSQSCESIVDLVSRASSCEEANAWPLASLDLNDAEQLFKRWESRLLRMHSDRGLLQKRLESMGLTRESAITRFASRSMPAGHPLPPWAQFLEKVLDPQQTLMTVLPAAETRDSSQVDSTDRFPVFPELASPFLSIGMEMLSTNACVQRWFEPHAIDCVATMLQNRISSISARTLAHELKLRSQAGELNGETPEDRYVDFMQRFAATNEGRLALFEKYPVLARLLATRTLQTIEIIIEIAERLESDANKISEQLLGGKPLTKVSCLKLGLSDPHLNGRSVTILDFADDSKIVYKPRSLGIDLAYAKLVEWWNAISPSLSLKCAAVISREDYGWAEYVVASDCQDREDVAEYYRRQGAHTALFHFLQSSDFHGDNFIAAGGFPVPIDLECIMTSTQALKPLSAPDVPAEFRPPSLIGTGMLPMWKPGNDGQVCSVNCGIAGQASRPTTETVAVWKGIETDKLTLVFEQKSVLEDKSPCLPQLNGIAIGPENFLDELEDGFTFAYNAMISHREQLLDPNGPLRYFRGVRTRALLRTTSEYAFLLAWSTSPDHLTSGAAHDLSFELLATYGAACGNSIDIIDVEKRQLWQRDVPVFSGKTDENCIIDDAGNTLDVDLKSTCFQQIESSLASASADSLDWQRQILAASIRMACDSAIEIKAGNEAKTTTYHILAEAIRLGECLSNMAIRSDSGATWLTLETEPHDPRALTMDYARDGLYSGSAGMALFLANLSVQAQQLKFADLARQALDFAMARDGWTLKQWPAYRDRINAFGSSYSTVYSLAECGRILGDESLLKRAVECSERQNPTPAVDDPDFINGAAGALSVLLHLHGLTQHASLLERAKHLADCIGVSPRLDSGWQPASHRRPLLGLGHGQVGIAMALTRWESASGDTRWSQAIDDSLAYEARCFNSTHGDWPNLQSHESEPQFLIGWCGGAPGHGLARLELLKHRGSRQQVTLMEVEAAIASAKRHTGPGPENLCCGKPGKLWLLSQAGRQWNRPELCELASDEAMSFISDRHERGGWHLRPVTERDTLPTLMGGIAGIGLSLLQVLAPGVSQVATLS